MGKFISEKVRNTDFLKSVRQRGDDEHGDLISWARRPTCQRCGRFASRWSVVSSAGFFCCARLISRRGRRIPPWRFTVAATCAPFRDRVCTWSPRCADCRSNVSAPSCNHVRTLARPGAHFVPTVCGPWIDPVRTMARLGADFVPTWCATGSDSSRTRARPGADFGARRETTTSTNS